MGMPRLDLMLIGAKNSGRISHQRKLERIEEYNKNPKICKLITCSNPIPYKNKHRQIFCSSKCAIMDHNPIYKRTNYTKNIVDIKCKICKKIIKRNRRNINNKYCSRKCFQDNRSELKNIEIEKGLIHHRPTLRRYLVNKYGYCCFVCKLTNWMNKQISLEVDHIDGNHKNNFPENIRLICPNCHSQTPTYKAKNKGNGRKSRRKS